MTAKVKNILARYLSLYALRGKMSRMLVIIALLYLQYETKKDFIQLPTNTILSSFIQFYFPTGFT